MCSIPHQLPIKDGEKNLPIYKLFKGTSPFVWMEECKKAFSELKEALGQAPILVAPKEGEILFMYLAATEIVVSAVIYFFRNEKENVACLLCEPRTNRNRNKLHIAQKTYLFLSNVSPKTPPIFLSTPRDNTHKRTFKAHLAQARPNRLYEKMGARVK